MEPIDTAQKSGEIFPFAKLPKDLKKLILEYVSEPKTTRLVSKKWMALTNQNFINDYKAVRFASNRNQFVERIRFLKVKYYPGQGKIPIFRLYFALLKEQMSELRVLKEKKCVIGKVPFSTEESAKNAKEYLAREQWIEDENFLRCCKKINPISNYLSTLLKSDLDHHSVAEKMRDYIKAYEDSDKVTFISFECVGITRLPIEITRFTKLQQLSCCMNDIRYIPRWIAIFQDLQVLAANDNKICYLPATIGDLKKLNYLDFNINKLSSFPLSLMKLKNLETLDFSNNQFKMLPYKFGELENLLRLYINNNELEDLSPIENLQRLEVIDFRNNRFESLPIQIRQLPNLHIIYLDNPLGHGRISCCNIL